MVTEAIGAAPTAPEPVIGTRWRALLLAAVAACAACGIVYELAVVPRQVVNGVVSANR